MRPVVNPVTGSLKRAGLAERISHLRTGDRIALAVMWATLLFLGLPGLVLTFLNDPENLPIALTVVIGGTIVVSTISVVRLFPKGPRPRRASAQRGNEGS